MCVCVPFGVCQKMDLLPWRLPFIVRGERDKERDKVFGLSQPWAGAWHTPQAVGRSVAHTASRGPERGTHRKPWAGAWHTPQAVGGRVLVKQTNNTPSLTGLLAHPTLCLRVYSSVTSCARLSVSAAAPPLPPPTHSHTTMADTLHMSLPPPRTSSLHRLSVRLAATLRRISTSGAVTPEEALTPGSRRLLSVRTSEWTRDEALHKRAEHGNVWMICGGTVGRGRGRNWAPTTVTSTSACSTPPTPPPTALFAGRHPLHCLASPGRHLWRHWHFPPVHAGGGV